MNKQVLFFVVLVLAISCNKEKQSLKNLDGNWEVTGYQEVIFDGTTNFYTVLDGNLDVESSKNSKDGTFVLSWIATHESDTSSYDFSGNFTQESLDKLLLTSPVDTLECKISRQLKKNMTIGLIVEPNRKSVLHLKKK